MLGIPHGKDNEQGEHILMNILKKSLLIYMTEDALKPTGGQAGYNYNLVEGLKKIGAMGYSFLPITNNARSKLKSMKDGKLKKVLFVFLRIGNYFRLLHKKESFLACDLGKFDVVHFHNVKDTYEGRSSLENYNGLVILTSHSPKPFSMEIYEDIISPFERACFGRMYKKLICMERYAFNRADYIIFPCKFAEEPYYNKWNEYVKIHEKNQEKYRYLLTGARQCYAKVDKDNYRKKCEIPQDAFVISYVGRHNYTKGYDDLKNIGKSLLTDKSSYVLIAGKEEPLKRLEHDRWIEVGWTDDPYSLINASNLFVLPNKETYFDLVMLEVLSLGKIVVASKTGGNKFFETIDAPGVFLYSSLEDAKRIIESIKSMDVQEIQNLEESNRNLFDKYFSTEVFAETYIKIINEL